MKVTVGVLACVLFVHPFAAQERAPQNDSIRKAALKADLYFLAHDLMEGRLVGTKGYALAAAFVKSRFERLGLLPPDPEGSYFHSFNLAVATLGDGNRLEVTDGTGLSMRRVSGQDFYPHRFGSSGHAQGEVVFAGFGITAPALSYDDYRGADVSGRFVLVLDHEPRETDPASPFEGVVTAEAAVPFRKALAAQEAGAIGILFVTDLHNHPGELDFPAEARAYWPAAPPRIDRFFLASYLDRIRIPAAQISPALAVALIRGTGRSLDELSRSAETAQGITPIRLPNVQVALTQQVIRNVIPDRSVVGLLEGSDPQLKEEVVIIAAHHDHEGTDGTQVFNGADDNASGTVAVIGIAEAYALAAQAGRRPRRSILFAVFGSEERGPLLGSWAYTERPLWPLDRTLAVLNMDMIGRHMEVPAGGGRRFRGLPPQSAQSNSNSVNLIGHSRSPALREAVERANSAFRLTLKTDLDNNVSNLLRRSDQWPFIQRGVPAIWFHTGLHPDYHTPDDRPEKIEYEKMERIVRLVHQVSWDLAQGTSGATSTGGPRAAR
ncbi:MAG: M28 family peptidase [Acidobacteria bacterium]|nr:M28 family peptidase [Acidobacteriota bacterium]